MDSSFFNFSQNASTSAIADAASSALAQTGMFIS